MPSLLYRTRGGGARLRRPTRERTLYCSKLCQRDSFSISLLRGQEGSSGVAARFDQGSSQPPASPKRARLSPKGGQTYRTILPWMAQETQYCSLRYILGTVYSAKTEASEISPGESNCQQNVRRSLGSVGRWGVEVLSGRRRDGRQVRTDSRGLNHVADGEPLDGLILGSASRAVGAPDGLDVAATCEGLG